MILNSRVGSSAGITLQRLGYNTIFDADNPLGNFTIPADGASLANITDDGPNGNNISQATGATQIIYKRNIINSRNVFRFAGAQFLSCVTSANNNYVGPMTFVALAATTNTTQFGSILAKAGVGGTGWRAGTTTSTDFKGLFTLPGVVDIKTTAALWASGVWAAVAFRFNADKSVDFFKNRALVQNVANSSAMTVSTGDFIFGARTTSLIDPFKGDVNLAGVRFAVQTDSQVIQALKILTARGNL